MTELDVAATEALGLVSGVLAAADEALAAFATLRERVARAEELQDTGWARLREHAQRLLVQAGEEAREVAAARGEAVASLDELGAGLSALREEVPGEIEQTRSEVEALSSRLETVPPEVSGLAAAAEEADRRLQARLHALQVEVSEALARNEESLRAELLAEMKRVDEEVERVTIGLQDYVDTECLPALVSRSQELFDQLVQAEEDLRASLEAASEDTEATTDDALRVGNETFNETLEELDQLGSALEELVDRLRSFVEDGMDGFEDQGDRWEAAVRAVESGLKEARDALRDMEELLSRYSFVRL